MSQVDVTTTLSSPKLNTMPCRTSWPLLSVSRIIFYHRLSFPSIWASTGHLFIDCPLYRLPLVSIAPPVIIDIAVPYDYPENLHNAFNQKVDKNIHLDILYPLIVVSYGTLNKTYSSLLPATRSGLKSTRRCSKDKKYKIIQIFLQVFKFKLKDIIRYLCKNVVKFLKGGFPSPHILIILD